MTNTITAAGLAALLLLGACARGPDAAEGDPAAPLPAAAEAPAPEVFDLAAEGLWDGRPSLGGVWVAHPDVDLPERVLIRSGDREIDGALFRRERESAGPPFQLSSAAATELGIPPGVARELRVTALRPVPEADPGPAPDDGAPDEDAPNDDAPDDAPDDAS